MVTLTSQSPFGSFRSSPWFRSITPCVINCRRLNRLSARSGLRRWGAKSHVNRGLQQVSIAFRLVPVFAELMCATPFRIAQSSQSPFGSFRSSPCSVKKGKVMHTAVSIAFRLVPVFAADQCLRRCGR